MKSHIFLGLFGLATLFAIAGAACEATDTSSRNDDDDDDNDGNSGASGGTGGNLLTDGGTGASGGFVGDPTTCEQAAQAKTYLGCDFWPTVVGNNVWSIFDYAVVVANAGEEPASVTVTRNGQTFGTADIPPNQLAKLFLPWVPELKGPDADVCGSATPISATVRSPGGAYHLTSSRPVTVYQFNALEYQGAGGPPGKNWASCPGNQICPQYLAPVGCFSFSNDASLLLPSTAWTGNYRVTGQAGWPVANIGSYFAVTGMQDGTNVTVTLSPTGNILGGGGVSGASGGQTVTFPLAAGEVVEVVADPNSDLSGTLVQATAPVQVIAGMPCVQAPLGAQACDHIEESVFPAETLGKRYMVTVPTSPAGNPIGHIVRLYGNVDGTVLTYPSGPPAGAPATLNAGQVVDMGIVGQDFEVSGDHEFAVGSFQLGATYADPSGLGQGDPAQSLMTAVEQYRIKYVFLAPDDYDVSYVDIVMPMTAGVTLDGASMGVAPVAIGSSGFGVARVPLGAGNAGAHVLESTEAVGIQVMGYGSYTSYQYPGGLNLDLIAPPPPPPS